jgi:excisionase family DNA binding protein
MNATAVDAETREPLLTTQDVASFLGLPATTLKKWRATRTGPRAYKVGKHVRYRFSDVEAWLAERVSES